jgi:hypothetical protein
MLPCSKVEKKAALEMNRSLNRGCAATGRVCEADQYEPHTQALPFSPTPAQQRSRSKQNSFAPRELVLGAELAQALPGVFYSTISRGGWPGGHPTNSWVVADPVVKLVRALIPARNLLLKLKSPSSRAV